jgi:putative FmdB family regulatory protein
MALLDFKCDNCGEGFFEVVKSEAEEVKCPKCGSENVKRVYKGKFYGKSGGSCSGGNCSSCSGCGH